MDLLAKVLKPIPVVVWGGPALEHCGVRAFIHGYIFIVNECDRGLAEAKLLDAGFIRAHWSWGSCDPAELQKLDDNIQRMHERSIPEYEDIDSNSIRFVFPPEYVGIVNEPVALILPSFVGLGPPHTAALESGEFAGGEEQKEGNSTQSSETRQVGAPSQQEEVWLHEPALLPTPVLLPGLEEHPERENLQPTKNPRIATSPRDTTTNAPDMEKLQDEGKLCEKIAADDPRFARIDGFLYYPRLPVLLESLIRARLRLPEDKFGLWVSMLEVWAITYLWAQTMAPEDVLDGIEDEKVKSWFNKATKRFEGGIDRVTITKRKGRVQSTRPPVDLDTLFQDHGSSDT